MTSDSQAPAESGRSQTKLILLGTGGLVFVLLAALNFEEVEVNWIVGSFQTPLVILILVTFALGLGTGMLLSRRRKAE